MDAVRWLILLSPLLLWFFLAGAMAGWPKLARIRSFLVFVTIGPLIGFLCFVYPSMPRYDLSILVTGLWLSYLYGIVPAALASVISRRRSLHRWLVFAGLGPPIGLTTVVIYIIASGGRFRWTKFFDTEMLTLTYGFGLIPALIAAYAVGFVEKSTGDKALRVTLIGATIGVILPLPLTLTTSGNIGDIPLGVFAICAIASVVPTLVCWWIAKKLDARSEPTKTAVGGTLS